MCRGKQLQNPGNGLNVTQKGFDLADGRGDIYDVAAIAVKDDVDPFMAAKTFIFSCLDRIRRKSPLEHPGISAYRKGPWFPPNPNSL